MPLNIPDVSQEPRYIAIQGSRGGSELIVPIIAKEQVIGTLDALSDRVSAFDDTVLLVMQSLAHQVGAAIENARLFQAEQRRAEQFRVISADWNNSWWDHVRALAFFNGRNFLRSLYYKMLTREDVSDKEMILQMLRETLDQVIPIIIPEL